MIGKRALLSWLIDTGRVGRAVTRLAWSQRLSRGGPAVLVLNYHRIGDPGQTPFDRGCFSATAKQFEQQIRYVQKRCTLISVADLDAITDPDGPPPPKRPVLLTFDDGYADNFHLAFPILKSLGATATFFPTTGFIDRTSMAWWDEIAWLMRRLPTGPLELPEFALSLSLDGSPFDVDTEQPTGDDREPAIRTVLQRYKDLPADRAAALLDAIGRRVSEATGETATRLTPPDDLYMTWDQLREMQAAGMTIGGHSISHPVLARIDAECQRREIAGCRDRLAEQLGRTPTVFAYPVGGPDTFTEQTQAIVRQAGYRWSFQFFGNLWRLGTERGRVANRFAIPRVAVCHESRPHQFRTQIACPPLGR